MADLDTAAKRLAGMDPAAPWRRTLPIPDGTIATADREALLFLYSGIAPSATVTGAFSGAAVLTGTFVGVSTHAGAFSGAATLTGTAVGVTTHAGAFTGAALLTGAAVGRDASASGTAAGIFYRVGGERRLLWVAREARTLRAH